MDNIVEKVQKIIEEPEIEDPKDIAKAIIQLVREDGVVFTHVNAAAVADDRLLATAESDPEGYTKFLKDKIAREVAETLMRENYIQFDTRRDYGRRQTILTGSVKVVKKT